MARTALTVTAVARTGNDVATLSAANVDGHSVVNTGRMFIFVKNGDASPHTVTVQTPRTVDGLAVAELAVVVAAGEHKLIGPFPVNTFNQVGADYGKIYVDFDAVTSVTCAAFSV